MTYIPGDEHSVDEDERRGNYEDGVWVGPPLAELADDFRGQVDDLRKALKESGYIPPDKP